MTGPSFLEDNIGQEVVVVDRNRSMIVHNQCWSFVRDVLQPMDLIAWYTGHRMQGWAVFTVRKC